MMVKWQVALGLANKGKTFSCVRLSVHQLVIKHFTLGDETLAFGTNSVAFRSHSVANPAAYAIKAPKEHQYKFDEKKVN